jgi:hypothetical protein
MNPKERFRLATRLSTLLVLVFLFVSTAAAEWHEKVLYSFQGGADGQTPAGGVIFDKVGNLYGATVDGGADNCSPMAACGTVFQLEPPANKGEAWTETVLYVFKGRAFNDGESPDGGFVMDAAGNLYGTAAYGGTGDCVLLGIKGGCGTVYEMSPPAQKGGDWTETTLYSFKGGDDGYVPQGNLVFDSAGNLYGATLFGGGKGTTCDPFYQYCGTVFELSPPKQKGGKWTEKVLHSFAGGSTDGANPNGGLVLGTTGAIYGTTYAGGNQSCKYDGSLGCGTAFELEPPVSKGAAWKEVVQQRFSVAEANPWAGVTLDGNGSLYGTTLTTVFRLSSAKSDRWKEAVLHGFSYGDGPYNPEGTLIFDEAGDLYGTTYIGSGSNLHGSVFLLKPSHKKTGSWALTVIHGFLGPPDGDFPAAGIVFDADGDLYSTTQAGGTGTGCGYGGCGTVFEVLP